MQPDDAPAITRPGDRGVRVHAVGSVEQARGGDRVAVEHSGADHPVAKAGLIGLRPGDGGAHAVGRRGRCSDEGTRGLGHDGRDELRPLQAIAVQVAGVASPLGTHPAVTNGDDGLDVADLPLAALASAQGAVRERVALVVERDRITTAVAEDERAVIVDFAFGLEAAFGGVARLFAAHPAAEVGNAVAQPDVAALEAIALCVGAAGISTDELVGLEVGEVAHVSAATGIATVRRSAVPHRDRVAPGRHRGRVEGHAARLGAGLFTV